VALGVPKGPLFGRLCRGEAVTGAGGATVLPADVMQPATPGPTAAVVDCPSPAYLPSLVADPGMQRLRSGGARDLWPSGHSALNPNPKPVTLESRRCSRASRVKTGFWGSTTNPDPEPHNSVPQSSLSRVCQQQHPKTLTPKDLRQSVPVSV
jgi:hypothetical protein